MLKSLIKVARPGHWPKNGVVLAALVFAGSAAEVPMVELAFAAMAVFCLLSSMAYTVNDIIDREKDKQHPLKKERPVASGKLPVSTAWLFAFGLAAVGLGTAWWISCNFLYISLGFVALNFLYSFWLKNVVVLDVMMIALNFVVRAYAGAIAINVPASHWLIINTFLLALFLGFGKRRHELMLLEQGASAHRKILDKYSPYLLDQLIGVVTASVVVVYMLYTFSDETAVKLGTTNLFITIPFVVYGVFRYLYLIHKEQEGGSPARVLFSDRPTLINVILWLITVIVVLYVL